MPTGMLTVNAPGSFATCLLMSSGPRLEYGSTEQDRTAAGQLRWSTVVAVTYLADPGQPGKPPASEVLTITINADHDPADGITPGSLVELVDLRVGVSTPQAREGGRVSGGRLYFTASGVRSSLIPGRVGKDAA